MLVREATAGIDDTGVPAMDEVVTVVVVKLTRVVILGAPVGGWTHVVGGGTYGLVFRGGDTPGPSWIGAGVLP